MRWLLTLAIFLVVSEAGWMVFDGVHAFATGDYVTPAEGPYAGQLGPWAPVVRAIGMPPRSAAMKLVFIVYGSAWLGCCVPFALRRRWGWWAMLGFAVGSLWYLVVGTITSVVLIGVLVSSPVRRGFRAQRVPASAP